MGHYQVQAPDGHIYEFEAPDDATPEQLDAMTREAAGYAKHYPVKAGAQPAPGIGQQLLGAVKNDLAGIAQGAAAIPDMAASALGKAVSAIPNAVGHGLDQLGFNNAANWVQGNLTHPLANPLQIGDVIENAAPTPDDAAGKTGRFVAQLMGGAAAVPAGAVDSAVARLVGTAPKALVSTEAKLAAPQIIEAGKQANVPVMTSDVMPPKTFIGKSIMAMGERVPYAGMGGPRAAQQADRVAAVKNLAQEYGAASGDELATPAVDAVANDLAKTRSTLIGKLTNQKNAVIDKIQGQVPVANATEAIDQEIGKLEATGYNGYTPVIAKLNDWRQALQGKDLRTIEQLRKQIGQDFSAPDMASVRDVAEKALSNIYGPLRSDMGAFIKNAGEPGDFNRWKVANDTLSGMVGQLKNSALKKALATADATPENVASLLFSTKPSDVRLLYSGLTSTGRAKAQAAILQKAVEKAGGMENISPDRFAGQVKALGKSIGVFFEGKELARIDGLSRVLTATKRASEASLAPPTGVQAVPYAAAALFTEATGSAFKGLLASAGSGLLARAYESAPVRDLLVKLGRSKPASSQETMLMKRTLAAIMSGAKTNAPSGVLNDNVSAITSAAASPAGADPYSNQ